jgi:hypothetical protein
LYNVQSPTRISNHLEIAALNVGWEEVDIVTKPSLVGTEIGVVA